MNIRPSNYLITLKLLLEKPQADQWSTLSSYLDQIASTGDAFWQVDYLRRHYEVRRGAASEAIANVRHDLDRELPLQRYLALQVLLGELLVLDRDYGNARIHCSSIEEDVGNGLLDLELRLKYLQFCAEAWKREDQFDSNEASRRAVRIYDRAIVRFRREL